jgi:hypothetical protein
MDDAAEDLRTKDARVRKTMREGLEAQFTEVALGPWKPLEGSEPGYYYADFQGRCRADGTPVQGSAGLHSKFGLCLAYSAVDRLEPMESLPPAASPARKPPGKVGFSFTV